MGHYAKVVDGVVASVIVAEQEFFDTFIDSSPGEWVQTSYNTVGGTHINGGIPLRMNFAGLGSIYNSELDAFHSPQPHPSWVLSVETCTWDAPYPYPSTGGLYRWDEESLTWVEVVDG